MRAQPSQIIISLPFPKARGLEPAGRAEVAGMLDGDGELGHGLVGGRRDGADDGGGAAGEEVEFIWVVRLVIQGR